MCRNRAAPSPPRGNPPIVGQPEAIEKPASGSWHRLKPKHLKLEALMSAAAPTALPSGAGEVSMIQATLHRHDQTAAGFDHPYGDYAPTVTDGAGELLRRLGRGRVKGWKRGCLLRKVLRNNSSLMSVVYIGVEDAFLLEIV